MAKYEAQINGSFQDFLYYLDQKILSGSMSASLEDSSRYSINGVEVAVRVYERYSWIGGNRLSMNVTLLGHGGRLHLTAITSGGSQAMFFKINTFGEEAFLDHMREAVSQYH